ncbi:MAG: hypothetical protein LBE70_03505 [Nitrososphaerota archaeon]|nr:hypothetical protein [Nitrososphaerota archaeon]
MSEKIVVSNENELRNAINAAIEPTSIAIDNDITLTRTIVIPANKDITLTSNTTNSFYKLFGSPGLSSISDGSSTLTVANGGMLRLDGIVVTHVSRFGSGVMVNSGGKLIMYSGEISGNNGNLGGGVFINGSGSFMMLGGKIFGNDALCGGGVENFGGTFNMTGGEISGNTAWGGGGVYNDGDFSMSGGKIFSNNVSTFGDRYGGGGVYNSGIFSMLGGEISGNNAVGGGAGGGVNNIGVFSMSGGEISNNTVAGDGGGVFNSGTFSVFCGKISDNTASKSGGGIWVYDKNFKKLFVSDGVVFSNNRASEAVPNRRPEHDAIYVKQIGNNVIWTTPFTQGYNNYDISYTNIPPTSPEPSNSPTTPEPSVPPSSSESNQSIKSMLDSYLVKFTIAVIIVSCIIGGLVFLYKKNKLNDTSKSSRF